MSMIIENWWVIVVLLCLVASIITNVIYFVIEPKETKVANVKEWLLYAVIEAEKKFGDKTGTIKLRYVYNLAIDKFPWLASMVSFQTFSMWVDTALVWAKAQLSSNSAIKEYVEKKDEDSTL